MWNKTRVVRRPRRCLQVTSVLSILIYVSISLLLTLQSLRRDIAKDAPFRVVPEWFKPERPPNLGILPEIHLLTAHYLAPTEYVAREQMRTRRSELYYCFQRQLASRAIDHIHVFYESDEAKQLMHKAHPKVTAHTINKRMTFRDAIQYSDRHLHNKIIVFGNNDIYFDGTLELVRYITWGRSSKRTVLSISRYEDHGFGRVSSPKVSSYYGSHDTFIWFSPMPPTIIQGLYGALDYPLGKPGSENRFIHIMGTMAKQRVLNPAFSISTWHCHNSNERTYTLQERVDLDHGNGKLLFPGQLEDVMYDPYLLRRSQKSETSYEIAWDSL